MLNLKKGGQDYEQKSTPIADILLHDYHGIIIHSIPANMLHIHRVRLTGNADNLYLFNLANSNSYSILHHRRLKGATTGRLQAENLPSMRKKYSSVTPKHGAITEHHSESPENTCVHGNA